MQQEDNSKTNNVKKMHHKGPTEKLKLNKTNLK